MKNINTISMYREKFHKLRVTQQLAVASFKLSGKQYITTNIPWKLNRDTCTLPGTMVQSVHVAFDKWGLMPPYPLKCIQVIATNHIKRFKK